MFNFQGDFEMRWLKSFLSSFPLRYMFDLQVYKHKSNNQLNEVLCVELELTDNEKRRHGKVVLSS